MLMPPETLGMFWWIFKGFVEKRISYKFVNVVSHQQDTTNFPKVMTEIIFMHTSKTHTLVIQRELEVISQGAFGSGTSWQFHSLPLQYITHRNTSPTNITYDAPSLCRGLPDDIR